MSEEVNVADGTPQVSNGKPEQENNEQVKSTPTPEEIQNAEGVLNKNRELLGKLKAANDELVSIKTAEKERETKALEEQNEWKKLAELRGKEAKDATEKASSLEKSFDDGKKLSAFLKAAPVKEKYWDLVDLDSIPINPETGEPDAAGVQQAADAFKEKFGEVLEIASKPGMPTQAPATNGSPGISIEEYRNMSLKDQKENAPRIVAQLEKEF